MAKKSSNMIGSWAFLIGVLLAIILGVIGGQLTDTWAMVLVIIGLVVGLLKIADEETSPFLMSGVSLIIASALGSSVLGSVPRANEILGALLAVFVPATIIVAIKNVFSLARN